MSEPSKTDGNPSQITSGIAFVALILGLFAVQNTIFQPTRPPMESTDRTFSEDVRSRLWQDPFQAVEEHRKKYSVQTREAADTFSMPTEIIYIDEKKQPKEFVLKAAPAQQNGNNKLIPSPDPQAKYAYELNGKEPKPVCYQKEVTKRENSYPDYSRIANSMDELQCQLATAAENSIKKKLHVLAVMVPGGPYAEEKEWRLRSRYAVVSALTEMDYAPRDAEHIDYVDFERTCKDALRELSDGAKISKPEDPSKKDKKQADSEDLREKTRFCHMGPFMPYEWFDMESKNDHDNHDKSVLLLWLNSSEFTSIDNSTPLRSLGFLKKQIRSGFKDSNFQFDILGPFGSGSLNKMFIEMLNRNKKNEKTEIYYSELEESSIYTPTATVSPEDFNKTMARLDKEKWLNAFFAKKWQDEKIIRTVSTQDKLVDLLLCELALRGITPYHIGDTSDKTLDEKCKPLSPKEFRLKDSQPWFNPLLKKIGLEDSRSPHHIVLIGEKDTYYSRRLTDTFSEAIRKFGEREKNKKETSSIHTFSYLRGLDGITSEAASSGKKEAKGNKESPANHSNNETTREQMERPVGNSQLDYLLGLAKEIKRLDKQYAHEGGIKAIGITGHDTYDKLLILQALRFQFPGVLFFTTELDARFFHPSEIKWTRNLLVASPFGLQLNSNFQKQTPPFRDNFQTSFFLTTKLALCDSTLISEPENCGNNLKKKAKEWTDYPRLFEIGNNGVVDISHAPNKYLDSKANSIQIQQKEFLEYVSLILIAISLLILLIVFFTPKDRRFSLKVIYSVMIIFLLIIYYLFKWYTGRELVSFTNGTSMWPSVLMKILACIVAVYLFLRTNTKLLQNQRSIEEKYLPINDGIKDEKSIKEKFLIELRETGMAWSMFFSYLLNPEKRKHLMNLLFIDCWKKDLMDGKMSQVKHPPINIFWKRYLYLGRWRFTVIRLIAALLVTFVLCVATLYSFNDVTFHHIRGQSNYEINFWCFVLAVLSYVLLILYVAERVHLSSHFIKLLANPKIEIDWPEAVRKTYRNKYGLPEEVVRYRVLLDFINDHCYAPNKFIYYPFFCLFLIVMSRNYYFDNWPTTPFVLAVYAFFALLTLISAIRLRAAALYAREQILGRLENNSADAPVNATWHRHRDNAVKLQSLITEIRDFKEGIYRPLAYHPMVLNLLVPFSSIGGIYLIEYLI